MFQAKLFALQYLLLSFVTLSQAKNKCPGDFNTKHVVNLCDSHFPNAASKTDKIWFVKFYAPWCGHCQKMKPEWEKLGKALKDDPLIKIGAVDCDNESNKRLCGEFGVQGFPTVKTIINGKGKAYNGAREFEPLKQYILNLKEKRGSKGGSAKCLKGIFKSAVKDSVLPLCSKHFPDNKSKHSWVMGFYNKDDFPASDKFNRLSLEFGNEPTDKNKSRKREEKQSVRVSEAIENYSIKGASATKKGGKSKDPLAKFGAICCDCEKDKVDAKCDGLTLPHFRVFDAKSKKTHEYPTSGSSEFNIDKFVAFALEKLGFVTLDKSAKEEL